MTTAERQTATAVLHVGGMYRGSENAVVEAVLCRRLGVLDVEGNAAAQTATVAYDPSVTSVAELRGWVEECGYNCAGRSVPDHICDPLMVEGGPPGPSDEAHAHGDHAGMSMDSMVHDMRNRFLVAVVFTIPTVSWFPVGETLWFEMRSRRRQRRDPRAARSRPAAGGGDP